MNESPKWAKYGEIVEAIPEPAHPRYADSRDRHGGEFGDDYRWRLIQHIDDTSTPQGEETDDEFEERTADIAYIEIIAIATSTVVACFRLYDGNNASSGGSIIFNSWAKDAIEKNTTNS